MQSLHLTALEPVAEQKADPNSYGFRKARSIQDAHVQCFIVLARKHGAEWILDADIHACFDRISHDWLLENAPMDKRILGQWLKAGYHEGDLFHPTEQGTPQGGSISPVLANLALDGLEGRIRKAAADCRTKAIPNPKVNFIRYADDLVVTAASREILQEIVIPATAAFLKERGLSLSAKKTRIVHIDEGFDFLGANIRKFGGKLIMQPRKTNVLGLARKVGDLTRRSRGTKTETLIGRLNPILRGWAYQFRHLVASKTFEYLDERIFWQLWRWACRRHGNKGKRWIKQRYFPDKGKRSWVFSARTSGEGGQSNTTAIFRMSTVPIRRHIKIRAEARFHDARYADYFNTRQLRTARHPKKRAEASLQQLELLF